MQHIKYIVSIVAVITLVGSAYFMYTVYQKINAHANAIQEISTVVVQGGLVVPDKDGKPTVNTLLLDAWKQQNGIE